MKANFNVKGAARKQLAGIIGELTEATPVYQGMPTAAYQIGAYTLSKIGELEWTDAVSDADAELLIERLLERGYEAEVEGRVEAPVEIPVAEESPHEAANFPAEEDPVDESPTPTVDGLAISMPRSKFSDTALENLHRLVESKGTLMKRAFMAADLPIEVDEEKVTFPWFSLTGPEETAAYTAFIQSICEMAINQSRISAKEKEIVNEKYEFRCFLLRLGFIGNDTKQIRKILLKNLSGSAAFKSGAKKAGDPE